MYHGRLAWGGPGSKKVKVKHLDLYVPDDRSGGYFLFGLVSTICVHFWPGREVGGAGSPLTIVAFLPDGVL